MKTFFNMLGPMVNPSFPSRQLVGVYNLELARIYSYLYQATEKQYLILHSLDGYDEISLTGPCKVITRELDRIYNPSDLNLPVYDPEELSGGGTVDAAMKIFIDVLENRASPARQDVVVANAGLALHICFPELSLEDCISKARESIESGSAMNTFRTLMGINKI
jgi:anthranilate phosphoribosyltransferase